MNFFNYYGYDEQKVCIPFYEQRDAQRKEVPQDSLVTTLLDSFFRDVTPPTPNNAEVDGYKSEAEMEN